MLKLAVIGALGSFIVAGHPAHAIASTTCSLSDGTLSIVRDETNQRGLEIVRAGDLIRVRYLETGCSGDTPTVQNVDTVEVDSSGLVINLRGGPFQPGMTEEADGISEIEFWFEGRNLGGTGSRSTDKIDVGEIASRTWGADLGSNGDIDWFYSRPPGTSWLESLTLRLGSGDDVVDGTGGSKAFSGPFAGGRLRVLGEGGADRIVGGAFRNSLQGGWGEDHLTGAHETDYIYAGQGRDRVDGRGGRDHLHGEDGADLILGRAGTDLVFAQDDWSDEVHCGRGHNDWVLDANRTDRLHGCEKVGTR